jgi:hypothetical protein
MVKLLHTLLALLLIIFTAFSTHAQTILAGTVRDAVGKPLEGILLEAETKTQPPATAFVISGADGSCKLTPCASRPAPWATPSSWCG